MFKTELKKVFYTITNNQTGDTDWEEDVVPVCSKCGAMVEGETDYACCPYCGHFEK